MKQYSISTSEFIIKKMKIIGANAWLSTLLGVTAASLMMSSSSSSSVSAFVIRSSHGNVNAFSGRTSSLSMSTPTSENSQSSDSVTADDTPTNPKTRTQKIMEKTPIEGQ